MDTQEESRYECNFLFNYFPHPRILFLFLSLCWHIPTQKAISNNSNNPKCAEFCGKSCLTWVSGLRMERSQSTRSLHQCTLLDSLFVWEFIIENTVSTRSFLRSAGIKRLCLERIRLRSLFIIPMIIWITPPANSHSPLYSSAAFLLFVTSHTRKIRG